MFARGARLGLERPRRRPSLHKASAHPAPHLTAARRGAIVVWDDGGFADPGDERATDRAPDVFVSYAREDTEFVERLYARLVDSGRTAFVDFRGIPVWSPDWQGELYEAIEGADAFLFVLSPDSLTSPNVALELRHAAEQGKRLKPLQLREVDPERIDPELGKPQWIDFRDPAAFDARFADLVAFLDTDVDWVRRHTRFGVLANEWTARGEDRTLLLGRSDLRDAEAWLAVRNGKEPEPTALQLRFVDASRRNMRRRRRILAGAVAVALAVALALGVVAILQTRSASTSADAAESRRLAASAVAALATDPAEGLKLAVQAAKVAQTQQAASALREALAQSHERAVLRAGESIDAAALSRDGGLVAVRTLEGTVVVWDAATAKKLATLTGPAPLNAFAFAPEGERLVTVGSTIQLWNARKGKLERTLPWAVTEQHVVAVSPNASLVGTSGFDGVAIVWSAKTGAKVATLRGHSQALRQLEFSPDGRRVLTTSDDGTARHLGRGDRRGARPPRDGRPRDRGGLEPRRRASRDRERQQHGAVVRRCHRSPGRRPEGRHGTRLGRPLRPRRHRDRDRRPGTHRPDLGCGDGRVALDAARAHGRHQRGGVQPRRPAPRHRELRRDGTRLGRLVGRRARGAPRAHGHRQHGELQPRRQPRAHCGQRRDRAHLGRRER